jgi:HEAT repeat protein
MTLLKTRILFVNLLILLIACSRDTVKSLHDSNPSMQELLQLIPANTATQTYLINKALLAQGSTGVLDLCLMLNGKDEQTKTAVEYALSSLSFQVTRSHNAEERQEFLQGIYLALQADQLRTERPLLISLLKIAGDETSLEPLARYLPDEMLGALAVPAMLNVGTPAAAKELLSALGRVSGNNRIAIIQALGQLRYRPAAGRIFEYVSDPDTVVRSVVISALANMGYEPLRPVLLESIAKSSAPYKEQLIIDYLKFIEQLKDKSRAAQYCREIITNSPAYFSGHNRLTAAGMLIDILAGTPALPEVLNFMQSCAAQDQLTILTFLEKLDTADLLTAIAAVKDKLPPLWQANFISMLGSRKDQRAIPFIAAAAQDSAVIIRAAAIKAQLQIQPGQASEFLIPVMCRENDSLLFDALPAALKSIPAQQLFPDLIEHYPEMSLAGRQLVLDLLGERQLSLYTDFVIKQLSAEQAEVRLAAMRNLPDLAVAGDLPVLLSQWQRTAAAEQEILFKSILNLIDRYQDEPATAKAIMEFAQNQDDSNREFLLRMLKQVANDQALQIWRSEMKSGKAEMKDAAWRTLCEWPRLNALNDLLNLAASTEDLTYRVLATRACLRLLQENDTGKEIEFQDYKRLLGSTPRLEDKQLVLAAMADLKSERVLHYLTTLINDPALGSAATMAIMNMVKSDSDSIAEIKGTEIAAVFLQIQLKPGSAVEKTASESDDSLHNVPPAGFFALFNGTDLTGWQGLVADPPTRAGMSPEELRKAQQQADQHMRLHWKIIDGILCFDGHGENLCTLKNYKNFELRLDWKIEKNGDSGIYLRGSPQVQIWDPGTSATGSGGLYNNQIGSSLPLQLSDRPAGAWNTFRIIMLGSRVTVYLNEQLVVDNVVLENYWERDKPIYASGPIELQAHNNPLYFRNIFIRELPDQDRPFSGDLFNGIDLTGWQIIDGLPDGWQVRDSVLYATGLDYGWISTDQTFGDFKLELEFRLPAGGNSGIFIRAPHEGDPAYTGMEIQLLDDYAQQYADLKPWQYCGSVYGIQAPAQRVSKPDGTWQKMVIECRGPQIKVILNDLLIVDTNLIKHMDKETAHPGIKRREGHIGLQNHSTRVEFRKIQLIEYE